MLRLTTFLTIALLSILPLTGCQQAQDAADQAQDTAGTAVDQAKDAATDATDKVKETTDGAVDQAKGFAGINEMKDGVTETISSVQAGDFPKAKEDFAKVQESWGSVSETMKDNKNYSAISEGVTNVQASLSGDNPDSGAVVGQLQGLLKNLGEAAKG
ncbi:hypothetical protein [Acaryochloris thomasi]|nr:hypothetical protein [Acaryochloris thomasi]